MRGIPPDGGRKLQHRAVAVATADGVMVLLEGNPRRVRCLMFNATAPATGSTVYVGNQRDVDNGALSAANGWPLNEEWINDVENKFWKELANVLELHTKAPVYALAVGADATVKIIEELTD